MNEIKQKIADALKKKGFNSRQVSIRTEDAGYSYAFHLKVRDPHVSLQEIEDIVHPHESVRHDEYTGEVLAGGNTYIFVKRDSSVKFGILEGVLELVKKVRGMNDGTGEKLGHYFIMNDSGSIRLSTDWEDGIHTNRMYSLLESDEMIAEWISYKISEMELDREYAKRKKAEEK